MSASRAAVAAALAAKDGAAGVRHGGALVRGSREKGRVRGGQARTCQPAKANQNPSQPKH